MTRAKPLPLALPRWAGAASATVLAIGVLALVGWVFDVQVLKSVLPGLVNMKVNTAAGLVMLGVALLVDPARVGTTVVRRVAAVAVGALGLATLIEYAGLDLGIDQILVRDPRSVGVLSPGRMPGITAACFALLGVALVLTTALRAPPRVADALLLAAGGVAFIALAGYAYGVSDLYGFGQATWVALHTAVAIALAAAAGLAANRERGVFALLTSSNDGGAVARRLVPVILLLPGGVGWLVLAGHRLGYFEFEFAVALFALVLTLALGVIAWSIARSLAHMHVARSEADRRSMIDPLTALLNRRGFELGANAAHAAAKRYGEPYAILTADLDGLKRVNDVSGHVAGDRVLNAFTAALRASTHESDVLGRLGGDEFAALLLGTDATGAIVIERKLAASFAAELRRIDISAGVSVGLAVFPGEGSNPHELLALCDSRMYQRKVTRAAGDIRPTVRIAGGPTPG